MLSIKKTLLLASMALAAIAVAAPAAAQAEWLHEGVKLEKEAEVKLSGTAEFGTPAGGYACVVHATLVAKPGNTGTVTAFEVTTDSCSGSGALEECVLIDDAPTNLPWDVHVSTVDTDLIITDAVVWNTFKVEAEVCNVHEVEVTFEEVTAVPDDSTAISSVTLSGEGTAHVNQGTPNPLTLPAVAGGKLNVLAPNAATYGIEHGA